MSYWLRKWRYFWAGLVTGHNGIGLRTEGGWIIVSVEIRGREVDVIREFIGEIDGSIHHHVTSLGIRDEWDRVRTGNPNMHKVQV